MNSRKGTLILAVLVIIALGVGLWWFLNRSTEVHPPESDDILTETVNLQPFDDYRSGGHASRTIQNDTYNFTVSALMEVPGENKFYQAWLIKDGYPKQYISMGKLEYRGNGVYSLTFTDETNISDYRTILVTEEAKDDGNPETGLIQGTFQ